MGTTEESGAARRRPKARLMKPEFDMLASLVRQISAISLDDGKTALMESRLHPLLDRFCCGTFADLRVRAETSEVVRREICDAITTNETSFFRDADVFRMVAEHFVPTVLNRSNRLHIWSAAASFGQEAYSLAMILREAIPDIDKCDIRIEGTDICHDATAYASYGAYSKFEVERGLDDRRLWQHFEPCGCGYRVKDELRYLAHFRQLNLMDPIPFGQEFDIIFCRNVAIYFDRETRVELFGKLARHLTPGGKLVIGSTETLWQLTDLWRREEYDGVVYYVLDDC